MSAVVIQSWVSPQRQSSPLQRSALLLTLLLLAAVGALEAAGVRLRVSLPGELAVDVQETVRHHRQLRIPADQHLHTDTGGELRSVKLHLLEPASV